MPKLIRTALPASALACMALAVCLSTAPAHAQRAGDPYEYGLRLALFPVAFQAGISQSWFGSALRAETDLGRVADIQIAGRLPWLEVAGETEPQGYTLRGGVSLHVIDRIERERLSRTVYSSDAPAVGGRRHGTDDDMDVPVSQKLGGPPSPLPEHGADVSAHMRVVHAVRVGYERTRAVERLRPNNADDSARHAINDLNLLYLGYSFGSHWNLPGQAAGGERALGFRRFYLDALFTLPDLYQSTPLPGDDGAPADRLVVGVRLGMEGAFNALIDSMQGLGFAYSLEAGALPGDSGAEGYLLVGLGVELDVATKAGPRPPS